MGDQEQGAGCAYYYLGVFCFLAFQQRAREYVYIYTHTSIHTCECVDMCTHTCNLEIMRNLWFIRPGFFLAFPYSIFMFLSPGEPWLATKSTHLLSPSTHLKFFQITLSIPLQKTKLLKNSIVFRASIPPPPALPRLREYSIWLHILWYYMPKLRVSSLFLFVPFLWVYLFLFALGFSCFSFFQFSLI